MLDVTDRNAAEAFLKESEIKFRTFVDFTHDWEYWIAPDGRIKYTSPSCERITGYRSVDFINDPDLLDSIVHPEDQGKWAHHRREITKASEPQNIDFRIVDRNDQIVWIAHSCQGVFGPDGEWMGRRASNRDVTGRIRAEKEIAEHLSMIEGVLKNAAEGICVCHSVNDYPFVRFTQWNQRMTAITGYSMDEINRLGWYQSMYPDPELRNRAIERMDRMRVGDDIRGEEWVITTKEGNQRPVLISTSLLRDPKGANHVLAIMHDITDRKRLEEEKLQIERNLLHTQKLESLSVMAGGIAHDFNNQLAVVLGNLELALMDLAPDSTARPRIDSAVEAAQRSAQLSRQMQTYTGNIFYFPTELDLNKLLNEKLDLLHWSPSKQVTMKLKTGSTLPPIKGDADQINRLVMNMLVNAAEAIGEKDGEIELSTGVTECDEAYLSRCHPVDKHRAGRFVFLQITDTGCGMDGESLVKLFDPFFTTKFWGRGLGMAEVIGIVKCHQGAIMVDSELGKGTTARVLFPAPIRDQPALGSDRFVAETESKGPDTAKKRKTILVVDDEELILDLMVRRLDHMDCDAITASDGEEAISVFRERMNEIDLVILDFKMPKMNGVQAFGELIRIKPDVRVILSTGLTEDVALERFPGPRPAGVLHKPYDMGILRNELNRLLWRAD